MNIKLHFKLYLLMFLAFVINVFALQAQVSINTSGNDPHPSAMLDIESTSSGLLIPRMTATERDNISSPATGLMVYVTDDNKFWYYDGTQWVTMIGSPDNDWVVAGNDMYSGVSGNVGIGVTNPGTKLHVKGVTLLERDGSPVVYIQNTTNNTFGYGDIAFERGDGSGNRMFFGTIGDNNNGIAALAITNSNDYIAAFTYAGNVGIGTTSPQYKLDVNGNIRHGDNLYIYSQTSSGSTAWARFNSPQTHGSNIFIGAGGTTVIGSGESSTYTRNSIDTNNAHETFYLTSDADIKLITNLQSGNWNDRIESLVLRNNRIWSMDFTTLRLHDKTLNNNSVDFIQRTQDYYYGYGVSINSGQGFAVGSGESANKLFVNIDLKSNEILYLTSDVNNNTEAIKFITSLQGDWADRVEAMTILGNGNVGIGLNNPVGHLHITHVNDAGPNGTAIPGGDVTIGDVNGTHIEIDDNEIYAMSGNNASTLYLNWEGGKVHLSDVIRIVPRTSAPSSPEEGDMYIHDNGSTKTLRIYLNGAWVDIVSN